jgi:hypothetical protein
MRGRVERGGRGLHGRGRADPREVQSRHGAAVEWSREARERNAQWEDEMVKTQQQKVDGDDVVMQEAGEGEVLPGDTTGIKCSRCTKRGHFAAACKAEIYCVICDKKNDHVNHKCPILKIPRPVAHAMGYAVHGLGFYHIPRPPLPRAKKDSRIALLSVEGVMSLWRR